MDGVKLGTLEPGEEFTTRITHRAGLVVKAATGPTDPVRVELTDEDGRVEIALLHPRVVVDQVRIGR